MYEFINTATIGLIFLFVHEQNSFWINISVMTFGLISTLNHLFPHNLKGLTHAVKFSYSLLLFSCGYEEREKYLPKENLVVAAGIVMILDIAPLFSKSVARLESFGAIIRRGILLIAYKEMFGTVYFPFCLLLEFIYYFERKERIDKNDRESFGLLHCSEHFAVILLLIHGFHLSHRFSLSSSCFILLLTWLIQALSMFIYNQLIEQTYPISVKDSSLQLHLNQIFHNKIRKQNTWHNIAVKPFLPPLSFRIMTWERMNQSIMNIIIKYQLQGINYDYIFGVSTGGALIAPLLAKQLEIPDNKIRILSSKIWSETDILSSTRLVVGMGLFNQLPNDLCQNKVNPFELFEKDRSLYQSKRILIIDDTVNTGITMKRLSEQLQGLSPKSMDFLCLIQSPNYSGEISFFYDEMTRVPIFWPWGAESD